MIVIIDNYDSFTQNLVQCTGELGYKIMVIRNDNFTKNNLDTIQPTHIIISPGPGKPEDSGISLKIIQNYSNQIPILGICLGHQAIGHVYGGTIKKLSKPIHGKTDEIFNNQQDIFRNLKSSFNATRYHSLIVDMETCPDVLKVTAWTKDGIIMGFQHKDHPKLRGIQFHPESLWTKEGKKIIRNFLLS
uniref:Anthranilate synthase component 2 n=1 Tax=Polysiphonia infestans TaxID=2006978 RepID=A0A1Z1MEM2_9FLOR|nr:Anthranilate synthase component II [Polysiphonia infestans]ARW64292.1 Anthranilate synthase component II [Polysiphonia infestans]